MVRILTIISISIFILYVLAVKSRVVETESKYRSLHQIDLTRRSQEEIEHANVDKNGFDVDSGIAVKSDTITSKNKQASRASSEDPDVWRNTISYRERVISGRRRRPAPYLRAGN